MAIAKAKSCVGLCFSLALCVAVLGQQNRQPSTGKSCRELVEGFYTWYAQEALKHNRMTQPDLALKSRPYLFNRDLAQQLREDSEAQTKAGSDLVSLDADPFVGADGPAERYVVERITIHDGKCWAEVHGVWEGKESETPDVTPELLHQDGRWLFANFYFPSPSGVNGWNLLGALKAGREFRKKYGPGNVK